MYDRIRPEGRISGDLRLHEIIEQNLESLEFVAVDTPIDLPLCITCEKKCPGYEVCTEPHIKWLWKNFDAHTSQKRPSKVFTPYTQRCVDAYVTTELEEPFHLSHAMGANAAPLLARALFVKRRWPKLSFIEVFPALSFYRIAKALGLSSMQSTDHRAAFGGDDQRAGFLHSLNAKDHVFIYNQDAKLMIQNPNAFDAFVCALTGYLKFKGQTEKRPKDFPKTESWIEFPKKNVSSSSLFS